MARFTELTFTELFQRFVTLFGRRRRVHYQEAREAFDTLYTTAIRHGINPEQADRVLVECAQWALVYFAGGKNRYAATYFYRQREYHIKRGNIQVPYPDVELPRKP